MIDIIDMLTMKDISLEEADKKLDDIIEWSHDGTIIENWSDAAGFSAYEATAFAQGARLNDLVKLRCNGWPNRCVLCGGFIEYKEYGWWFVQKKDGLPGLRHIERPILMT